MTPKILKNSSDNPSAEGHVYDTIRYYYGFKEENDFKFKIARLDGNILIIALVVKTKEGYDIWNFYEKRRMLSKAYTLKECCVETQLNATLESLKRLLQP